MGHGLFGIMLGTGRPKKNTSIAKFNRSIDRMLGAKPNYGTEYTEHQKAYINGNIPLEEAKLGEVRYLMNKALSLNDQETYDKVSGLYETYLLEGYKPEISYEEAVSILDEIKNRE